MGEEETRTGVVVMTSKISMVMEPINGLVNGFLLYNYRPQLRIKNLKNIKSFGNNFYVPEQALASCDNPWHAIRFCCFYKIS
jgi:hypothetical protein